MDYNQLEEELRYTQKEMEKTQGHGNGEFDVLALFAHVLIRSIASLS